MKIRTSRVLRNIAAQQLSPCMKANLTDPRIVELCGHAGMSAVWLCREHVPGDWIQLEHCIRAAKLHDVDSIVRVSKGSYSDYIKPFECDATAIMVPHVETAAEAKHIVDICRFRPLGRRAMDGGNADGWFTQMGVADYVHNSNTERFIILQIESPEAVANVEAIAAVPGYEFLLFGPGDYAHRIGKTAQVHDPEVLEARAVVEAAAKKHGKHLMAVAAPGTPAELWQKGYRITNLISDVGALSHALNQSFRDFQAQQVTAPSDYNDSTQK